MRALAFALTLMAVCVMAGTAHAWPARSTSPLNLRVAPGIHNHIILTIPFGGYLRVVGCSSWCQVEYAGRHGWVNSNYIAPLEGGPPPVVTAPPITRPPYWGLPVFKRRQPIPQPVPPAGIPRASN
ncbi:SH3 domain-containing protein [Pseudovibrio sp. SPO723]|uniref:SH3 domain-containing protein n=1 Tax=Nesiotobacter zosterae TaxID=392721 RepID=UPI0029C2B237|nr:SH3 domain-containing protein [Pseudovibrio sp. SPO723]MDX5592753.1 SH3 domain-containing protein [Pseudovibrio sp. SPO723]